MVLIFLAAGWLGSIVILAAGYASIEFLRPRPVHSDEA
jgi:hypothetical protein